MSRIIPSPVIPSPVAGPAWEIALLFPEQGQWSFDDYLDVSERTSRHVELCRGRVEVPDMPGRVHRKIAAALHRALDDFVTARSLGEALFAPYPMRVSGDTFREPDVLFAFAGGAHTFGERFADGADWVAEVLSSNRETDLVTKRAEYAAAGVSEYWIVDPGAGTIAVLVLDGAAYAELGPYVRGQRVASSIIGGFEVDVGAIVEAGSIAPR